MSPGSCSPLPRKHGGHCVQHALWLARAGAKAFLPTFFSPVASSKFGRACTFQTRDGTFAGNAIGSHPAPLRATLLHFFSKYLFRTLFFCTRSQKGNFKRFPTKWYTLSLFQSLEISKRPRSMGGGPGREGGVLQKSDARIRRSSSKLAHWATYFTLVGTAHWHECMSLRRVLYRAASTLGHSTRDSCICSPGGGVIKFRSLVQLADKMQPVDMG